LAAGHANAAPPPRHCVIDAGDGGTERCFDTYRAAISYTTRGAITDAPLDAASAVFDARFQAQVSALADRAARRTEPGMMILASLASDSDNSVIGATLFTGTNFTGDSETLRIAAPCVKDGYYDYGFTLGDISRRVQSVQPWANCWIWLHSGDTWDTPRQGPFKSDTADLGDWKNRAVSLGLS
jgi:hypothetical protein